MNDIRIKKKYIISDKDINMNRFITTRNVINLINQNDSVRNLIKESLPLQKI